MYCDTLVRIVEEKQLCFFVFFSASINLLTLDRSLTRKTRVRVTRSVGSRGIGSTGSSWCARYGQTAETQTPQES
jgi:hypothetical protein